MLKTWEVVEWKTPPDILKVEIECHIFRMLYYARDAAKDANATRHVYNRKKINGKSVQQMQKHILCKNAKYSVIFSVVHQILWVKCTHFNRNPRFLKYLDFPMQIVQQICHVDWQKAAWFESVLFLLVVRIVYILDSINFQLQLTDSVSSKSANTKLVNS